MRTLRCQSDLAILLLGVAAALAISCGVSAQSAPPQQSAAKTEKAAPAPRRDLSEFGPPEDTMEGISPAGREVACAFHGFGAKSPTTSTNPATGPRKVPIGLANDPLDSCDPAGFPRNLLFELRPFQVVQTAKQILMLYQYQQRMAGHLDRRARAAKGSRPAVVRIFGREVGG